MSFFDDARLRAKRRKSAWNFLLIPTIAIPWLGAWRYSVIALVHVYRFMHDGKSRSFPFWDSRNFRLLPPEGIAGIFVGLGPLFAWLPVAMLFGNLLVRGFPPARRALDREAERVSASPRDPTRAAEQRQTDSSTRDRTDEYRIVELPQTAAALLGDTRHRGYRYLVRVNNLELTTGGAA